MFSLYSRKTWQPLLSLHVTFILHSMLTSTRIQTPQRQHVHVQMHSLTNFQMLLKEMHSFFCFWNILIWKYDTYYVPLILIKQQHWKQGDIFIHKNTCNLWEIHRSSQRFGHVSALNTGNTHVPCSLRSNVVDPHFAIEYSVIPLHLGETYSGKKAIK